MRVARSQTETVNRHQGFVPFTAELNESWIEAGLGASVQLTASTSLYGNIIDGDAWGADGKIGLRVNW